MPTKLFYYPNDIIHSFFSNNYKPYWNENVKKLSRERDLIASSLERNWTDDKHIELKLIQDKLEKELIESKKQTFDDELNSMDYRTSASYTHRKISCINEDQNVRTNEAIIHNNTILSSNSSKAKFLKHYVNVSSGSSKIEKVKRMKKIKPFTIDELQAATQKIELDKSPGVDGIFFNNLY